MSNYFFFPFDSIFFSLAVIFKFLSSKTRVCIWLFEQTTSRIEGRILGFDEYMNLVVDEAEEVEVVPKGSSKKGSRKTLGRILLKGDNVTAISAITTSTSGTSTTSTSTT